MKQKILLACIALLTLFIVFGCGQKTAEEAADLTSIEWIETIPAALEKASAQDKIVMIKFAATWCPSCQRLEDHTLNELAVIRKVNQFVPVRIDVDLQTEVANAYNGNARKYGGVGIPNILFLDKDGNRLKHVVGYRPPEQFSAIVDSVLNGII